MLTYGAQYALHKSSYASFIYAAMLVTYPNSLRIHSFGPPSSSRLHAGACVLLRQTQGRLIKARPFLVLPPLLFEIEACGQASSPWHRPAYTQAPL